MYMYNMGVIKNHITINNVLMSYTILCMFYTFTAALCPMSVCNGVSLADGSHTHTTLSLPPEARWRLSGDHCSPHTSSE